MVAMDSLESLFEEISSGNEDLTIYMVLDAAINDELPGRLWQYDAPLRIMPLIEQGDDPELLAVAPFLVAMDKTEPIYEYLVDLAEYAPAGIFLVASEPWGQVVAEAGAWLWPQKQNGQRVYFRYYDPRVLSAMLQCHQTRGHSFPMGSFHQIFWHDPLREKTYSRKAALPGEPFSMASPWQLSAELEEALASFQILHHVVMDLPKTEPGFYRNLRPGGIYKRTEILVAMAESYGFFSFADILSFCHFSFRYPGFMEHENNRAAFDALKGRRHNRSFKDVLSDLPDAWLNEYLPTHRSDYHD